MKEIATVSTIDANIAVPGSKSLTQRALIAAALADGMSTLAGPLASEDTSYTSAALKNMGVTVQTDGDPWQVHGKAGRISTPSEPIFLGNNGTATRFLTSVAALGNGRFEITGDPRMAERPIMPLMQALEGWQVDINSIRGTGCPPLEVNAAGVAGGRTVLPEGKSSQYLSSLLLVAPYARQPAVLDVEGEVLSKPYVAMTLAVMRAFGIEAKAADDMSHFEIPTGVYASREYAIEGDASGASYFWAAAAITGGRVSVSNVPENSLQGDARLVDIFAQMGCRVNKTSTGMTVIGTPELRGVEVDMGDCPDVVPTLAVVAALAKGRTVIKNIAHLRIKECDRLHVVAVELAKLGVQVQELADTLIIEGVAGTDTKLHGATIDTYNDHRIAMCFAVAGLVIEGVRISGEECVVKSFPDFWERFDKLYA